jgi:hypothetical protein
MGEHVRVGCEVLNSVARLITLFDAMAEGQIRGVQAHDSFKGSEFVEFVGRTVRICFVEFQPSLVATHGMVDSFELFSVE